MHQPTKRAGRARRVCLVASFLISLVKRAARPDSARVQDASLSLLLGSGLWFSSFYSNPPAGLTVEDGKVPVFRLWCHLQAQDHACREKKRPSGKNPGVNPCDIDAPLSDPWTLLSRVFYCISSPTDALLIAHINCKCQVSITGRRIKKRGMLGAILLPVITSKCWFPVFI